MMSTNERLPPCPKYEVGDSNSNAIEILELSIRFLKNLQGNRGRGAPPNFAENQATFPSVGEATTGPDSELREASAERIPSDE
jgi:hypothetical protein